MLVQKFGGSSLADLDSFVSASAIVSAAAQKEKTVVVLSAMYGITDLLQAAISAAIEGGEYRAELETIRRREEEVMTGARAAGLDCPLSAACVQGVVCRRLPFRRNVGHVRGPFSVQAD